jgi:hypothetical protein
VRSRRVRSSASAFSSPLFLPIVCQPGQFDWLEKLSVEDLRLLAAGELDLAQFQPSVFSGRQSVN